MLICLNHSLVPLVILAMLLVLLGKEANSIASEFGQVLLVKDRSAMG